MRKNVIKGLLLSLVFSLVVVFGVACGGARATEIAITRLPEENKVVISDTVNTLSLGYTLTPENAKEDVAWTTSDNEVATVDDSGLVTLIDSGVVMVTVSLVRDASVKAEAILTVTDERTIIDTIAITGMPEGNVADYAVGSLQLQAECSDKAATLIWLSSNEKVATVNGSGLVTFTGSGETVITVYKEGQRALRATATLTVVSKVQSLSIADIETEYAFVGYEYKLETPYEPWNASPFEIEWRVSNDSIAKVENGVLKGIADGEVVVTAQIKGSEVKAEKTFRVMKLSETSEEFDYAKPNRIMINGVCTDGWLDYVGTKVAAHNMNIFVEKSSEGSKLVVERYNTSWEHWTQVAFGNWNLAAGKYRLTLDADVEGDSPITVFEGRYGTESADTGVIRAAAIEPALGLLGTDIKQNDGKYAIEFELTKPQEKVCVMLTSWGNQAYSVTVRSFLLEMVGFEVETDMYPDGALLLGETYSVSPIAMSGNSRFTYEFVGNEDGIVEWKNGTLTAKKEGNVKLVITEQPTGAKKEFELSVSKGIGFKNFEGATVATHDGNYSDLTVSGVYIRTQTMTATITDEGKLNLSAEASWDHHVWMNLGNVAAGIYEFKIVISGIDYWSFGGSMYYGSWKEDYVTNFTDGYIAPSGDQALKDEDGKNVNLYEITPVNGVYTVRCVVTEEMASERFGLQFAFAQAGKFDVEFTSFRFIKIPDIEVETDMYEDGLLLIGEEYNFAATFEGKACEYSFVGESDVIELKNGKLIPKKAGNVKLVVTAVNGNGKTLTKEFEIRVVENPFTAGSTVDENYDIAIVKGNEVLRTNVYILTNAITVTEKDGKLLMNGDPSWDHKVYFYLGNVTQGTYELKLGMDKLAGGFGGDIYFGYWTGNKTGYTDPDGDIALKDLSGNAVILSGMTPDANKVYTIRFNVTEAMANEHFGLRFAFATSDGFMGVELHSFSLEKLAEVESVEIAGLGTVEMGKETELAVDVAYAGGAQDGETYTAEWSVTASDGDATIANGKLTGTKAGEITLNVTVTTASGKTLTKSKTLTVVPGELVVDEDLYEDHLLVVGESYKFVPTELLSGMEFSYEYKTKDGSADAPGIVEVKDGKLTALTAGEVKVIVSSTVGGKRLTKEYDLKTAEGAAVRNFEGATVATHDGNYSDLTVSGVYIRTQTMTATITDEGKLNLSAEASWDHHVWMNLGNVAAGIYEFKIVISGIDYWSFGGSMYYGSWKEDYVTNFTDGYIAPSGDQALKDEDGKNVNLYEITPVNGVYTVRCVVTEEMASERFGLQFAFAQAGGFNVNFSSFRFVKVD